MGGHKKNHSEMEKKNGNVINVQ